MNPHFGLLRSKKIKETLKKLANLRKSGIAPNIKPHFGLPNKTKITTQSTKPIKSSRASKN
jgi:hypothetical protein